MQISVSDIQNHPAPAASAQPELNSDGLTEEKFAQIAGSTDCSSGKHGVNHNEIMAKTKDSSQSEPRHIVELGAEDLVAIAGGNSSEPKLPPILAGLPNHNETIVNSKEATQPKYNLKQLVLTTGASFSVLSAASAGQLASVVEVQHNETMVISQK